MRPLLTVLFSLSLVLVAGPLEMMTVAGILLVVASSFALGRILGESLGLDEPFGEFTLGFTLLCYAILIGLRLIPVHPYFIVFALLAFISAYAAYSFTTRRFFQPLRVRYRGALAVGALVAVLAALWSRDNFVRLEAFSLTGRLDFWVDIFVHAARLAEVGGSLAAGRGNALLADFPAPLYHIASYAPSALVLSVTDNTPLEIATLIWIPMGVLVMITGVLSLAYALGGQRLAVWVIPALALVPALDGFPLYNGFFSFPWLLEAGAGAFYGLGSSCTALAVLVLWMKGGRWSLLAAAVALTAATFLIRANFFVWLAPLVGLAVIHDSRRFLPSSIKVPPRSVIFVAFLFLVTSLIALSWKHLTDNAWEFLVGYLRLVQMGTAPTAYDRFFAIFEGGINLNIALIVSLPLLFLAIQGVWLPLFVFLRQRVRSVDLLRPWDNIPILLMVIVAVFTYLGPIPPNGDSSEFRHRATPLLFAITMIWTINFALLVPIKNNQTLGRIRPNWRLWLGAMTSLAVLAFTVSHAKVPRMDWGRNFFGQVFSPDLSIVAEVLRDDADRRSNFVIAGGSPDARLVDDAAVIVALSGVPAFMSCPQSILLRADIFGDDARRRVSIQSSLDNAGSVDELLGVMTSYNITHYVVLDPNLGLFDPDRSEASWFLDGIAIYEVGRS